MTMQDLFNKYASRLRFLHEHPELINKDSFKQTLSFFLADVDAFRAAQKTTEDIDIPRIEIIDTDLNVHEVYVNPTVNVIQKLCLDHDMNYAVTLSCIKNRSSGVSTVVFELPKYRDAYPPN